MGKMKNLVIEQETLAMVLDRAIENGDLVVCDRCGVSVLGEDMFGSVCNDCAMDLIEDGLARENEALEADAKVEKVLEDLLEDLLVQAAYEDMCKYGIPVGAVDLDLFLGGR